MNPKLDQLHDFVQPPPPSWMPQTIGWQVLFGLLLLVLIYETIHWLRAWRRNRYRRDALRELPLTPVTNLSALLKRTALAAWPRDQVAGLTGDRWLCFLNDTVDRPLFEFPPGSGIEECAMRNGSTLTVGDEKKLSALTEEWIRRHRVRV